MATVSQRSFAGGEVAPALYARIDTVKYATGLRTMRNAFVMRHGGAANRPGTAFVAEVRNSSQRVRLIPFIFNNEQTYVLEFGAAYLRFHRSGTPIRRTAQNITGITNANPGVLTYSGTDNYANGDHVYITGVTGAMAPFINNRTFNVASVNTGSNTFQLQYLDGTNVNTTSWGAYGSGGTIAEIYEISTPYAEADLAELQFVQSADVVTIVHPSYAPRELARTSDTSWSLSTLTFAPNIDAPTNGTASEVGTAGSSTYQYKVTAIADETYEESLPSSTITITDGNATLDADDFVRLNWDAVSGAQEYNVYKRKNGAYGLIGIAGSTQFDDIGQDVDISDSPPAARNPFSGTDNYPSAVTYFQQRLGFANTNNDPEKVWFSRTGQFKNFTANRPVQDDDAVTFTIAGRQVNAVKHMIDIGKLIILTTAGEWAIEGDSAGILTPTEVNPKQYSYNGSSSLAPLVIGGNALYVQGRGSVVRDLAFDYQVDGYRGNDLTIFSAHLFDGYTLTDWAYQQVPHSVVWIVRDDGKLIGLTYVREHQVVGWHHHDFDDGEVENVCVVPEGNEDAVYVTVKRTINGATKRYIERFNQRRIEDVVDAVFADSSASYDGRNTNTSHTMTMSEYSSGGWLYTSTVTLTSSTSYFSSSEVGNQIHMVGSDGTKIRFTIDEYVSATVVRGRPNVTVPVTMQAAAISDWTRAVDEVTGLWHLEGKNVSVLGDGFVVASPNNAAHNVRTVTNGTLALDKCYGVIHIGLPYTTDLQTLDIDSATTETLADKNKLVNRITMHVESSRGIFAGGEPPSDDDEDPLEGLTEYKPNNGENYDSPPDLLTETIQINIEPRWNANGRVFVRQVDPLPLAVLAIAPTGLVPFPSGR